MKRLVCDFLISSITDDNNLAQAKFILMNKAMFFRPRGIALFLVKPEYFRSIIGFIEPDDDDWKFIKARSIYVKQGKKEIISLLYASEKYEDRSQLPSHGVIEVQTPKKLIDLVISNYAPPGLPTIGVYGENVRDIADVAFRLSYPVWYLPQSYISQ